MRAWTAAAMVFLATLAGCADVADEPAPVDSDGDGVPDADEVANGTDPLAGFFPQVVVAVIDSGVNVYHEVYQRNASLPDHVLAGFTDAATGEAPKRIQLTQDGDYDERLKADEDAWSNMSRETLYYFEGTNVLGISFDQSDHPVLDDGSHGTGTTNAVLNANPDATIVLVEGVGNGAGEQWAASQPWIDFLSESYGPPGSPPTWLVMGSGTAEANKAAYGSGKLPIGAADNTPALAPVDSTAGPPWVVGVAGDHPEDECREHISGNAPDFTADFTQELARAGTIDEYRSMSGTSFATPTTAGTFSRILYEVRDAWGWEGGIREVTDDTGETRLAMAADLESGGAPAILTNVGLRDIVNQTAYYFGFGECGGTPVNPAAPWAQQGWGHVGPEIVETSVLGILGQQALDPKPQEARAYMEALYEERKATWGEP